MRTLSRSNIIETILLRKILSTLKTHGPGSRRELERAIKYEKLDFGEHNKFAREVPMGWTTPRCYNNASWAITSAEKAGYVIKHGGRGGKFEITPKGIKMLTSDDMSLRQSIEEAWEKHMDEQKKPVTYSYQPYFIGPFDSYEEAWLTMHKTLPTLQNQEGIKVENSVLHHMPNKGYLVCHVLKVTINLS